MLGGGKIFEGLMVQGASLSMASGIFSGVKTQIIYFSAYFAQRGTQISLIFQDI